MPLVKLFWASPASIFFIFISCTNNPLGPDADAQALAADESELVITYAPGDSAGSVTGNVILPTSGLKGSSISWETQDKSRISVKGIVNRPAAGAEDAYVNLTATLAIKSIRKEKVFSLVIRNLGFKENVLNAGSMKDIDGNVYWTVKIGSQIWTVENLRTTRYNDGTLIRNIKENKAWVGLTVPGFCYFNNMVNSDSIRKFGALYNWYAVNTKKLAPKGWHIPTDAEWTALSNYLISSGFNWDGTTKKNKIAKSLSAKTDWYAITGLHEGAIGNNITKNNKSGFLALPGGSRGTDGEFDFGGSGNWWSATQYNASGAIARNLYYDYENLFWNSNYKNNGFSVRLIKD